MTLSVLMVGNETFATRPGGLNRYMLSLRNALTTVGVDVGTLESESGGARRLPLRAVVLAMRARRGSRYDVVDTHFAPTGLLIQRSWRHRKAAHVVHFQGPWALEARVQDKASNAMTSVRHRIERLVYRRASAVITLSRGFRDLVVDAYAVDPSRVHVIPPGVDLTLFSFAPRPMVPTWLPHAPGSRLVVVTRRLTARMGLSTLIDAWSIVCRGTANAHLLVVGDGPERDAIAHQVERSSARDRISMLGRVSDAQLVDVYRAATLSVVPTRALEGFGLVVLESLACGTPCVVTRVGGLVDAIEGLDPSLIVEPGDPSALAERIIAALEGRVPSRRECRSYAAGFDWSRVAAAHLDLYRSLQDQPTR